MLKKVSRINYNTRYAFAPPDEDAVINTDEIVSVISVKTRRMEPCVLIKFKNRDQMTVIGTPSDFLIIGGPA